MLYVTVVATAVSQRSGIDLAVACSLRLGAQPSHSDCLTLAGTNSFSVPSAPRAGANNCPAGEPPLTP